MADAAPAYASHRQRGELEHNLARLHMRYARGRNPASTPPRADLVDVYKDPSHIRSKYKGAKAADTGKTTGIPIFGIEGAVERAGWSKGHIAARQALSRKLGVATENSHALGHADFGTDHELSAPAGSKSQNTEQFAIELGMRTAARQVNEGAKLDDGTSLVHAKITDVLHPQTGDLVARRYKLIRRAHKDDHDGTVVFDHIMDGARTSVSKDEAFDLGRQVHKSILTGVPVPRSTERAGDAKGHFDRKGMVAGAPNLGDIANHQATVLDTLNRARGSTAAERTRNRLAGIKDREGIGMVGPAFTSASFPATATSAGGMAHGQHALDEMRKRIAESSAGEITPEGLLTSGSLPADNQTKLLTALEGMQHIGAAQMRTAHRTVKHGSSDELSEADQARLAGRLEPEMPESTDDPRFHFVEHTGRAVKALRRMEADEVGSGFKILEASGVPLERLLAAHAYRNHYIGETKALVPEIASDEDEEEVDHKEGGAAAAGGDIVMDGAAGAGSKGGMH